MTIGSWLGAVIMPPLLNPSPLLLACRFLGARSERQLEASGTIERPRVHAAAAGDAFLREGKRFCGESESQRRSQHVRKILTRLFLSSPVPKTGSRMRRTRCVSPVPIFISVHRESFGALGQTKRRKKSANEESIIF